MFRFFRTLRPRRRRDREPQLTPWGFYAVPKPPSARPRRLLVAGAVLALTVGISGCLVAAGAVAHQVAAAFDEPAATSPATTRIRVQSGQAFRLADFRASRGWAVAAEPLGGPTITGLRVTNVDDRAHALRYAFTFRRGSRWLAEVDCSCPSVSTGETVAMRCVSSSHDMPRGYDLVLVADSY